MYSAVRKIVLSLVRERFHARRANAFMTLMKPQDDISILDVGGGWGDFLERIRKRLRARYVVAEIGEYYAPIVRKKYGFEFAQLEEGKPLPFVDKEFDIVISISVIEHATMPKEVCMSKISQEKWVSMSLKKQMQFANEIRRVGKAYFVQTPHKGFPIDSHTWLPLVNWLDHAHTVSLVRYIDKCWIKKCGYVDWNLLGVMDMKRLFPEAKINIERAFCMPKAIIAFTPPTPDTKSSRS
jgi:hypothetical protein